MYAFRLAGFLLTMAALSTACAWLKPACSVVRVAADTCDVFEVDGVQYKATPATIESLGLKMAAAREARAESALHGDGGAR